MYSVGPASKTLGRRCTDGKQMFCVCWDSSMYEEHSLWHVFLSMNINTYLKLDHCNYFSTRHAHDAWDMYIAIAATACHARVQSSFPVLGIQIANMHSVIPITV